MIKSITIKDVAEKAGVSKGSVWAALKTGKSSIRLAPATQERIQKVARELNYRPNIIAQSMVSKKSYLIGFNFSCNNNLWHHAVQIINGLRDCCKASGYSLVVYPANNVDEEYQNLQQAIKRQLDGLLTIPLLTGNRHNGKEYCRIAKEVMPIVQVCLPLCPELPSIVHDFSYIGKHATEYLLGRGHRQIVLVTFDNYRDPDNGITSYEHDQGYRLAMAEAGLNPRTFSHESHVFKHVADDAYRVAEQILQLSPRPTAIVTSSNSAAFGLIKRWKELGIKVPEDISIIGCADDLDIPDCLSPRLNSFKTEFEDIGKRAFQLCLEHKKQIKPEQFRIKLQLLEGKTVRDC
jgi:LacI family transcriptional regulator, galactose operon repressor